MKTIGKYIIKGLLGRGGMGRVYRVELPPIGKITALKRLEPDPLVEKLLGREKIDALFIAEATTLAAIHHSNIVEIMDFDQDEGKLFYVMSFHADNLGQLMGETYRPDIASRILPVEKAINYSRQILKGIACLHHFGIIHRDIKPFNILMAPSETLKICDFGLSKLRGESYAGPSNLNIGSPFYAAPEQEENPDEVEFSADLYSVGIILYRMLTGKLPSTSVRYPAVSRINADIDKNWDDFLHKAMAPNPKDRFQKAQQMLSQLQLLEKEWKMRKEKICAIATPLSEKSAPASSPVVLREERCKVSPSKAIDFFGLDSLWRPRRYIANRFIPVDSHLIQDRTTGLIWQRSGSPYPLNWHQAHFYVKQLNTERYGRKDGWRLPTIAQLTSLLTGLPSGRSLCIASLFDPRQNFLWSNDLSAFTAAWLVNLELGFVLSQDFSAQYFVRAVCRS